MMRTSVSEIYWKEAMDKSGYLYHTGREKSKNMGGFCPGGHQLILALTSHRSRGYSSENFPMEPLCPSPLIP
jgi:hypothetical protein